MGVPYWDSTLESELPEPLDSLIFTDIFFGEVNEKGFVVSGPYANWTTMEGRPWIFRGFGMNKDGELLNNARVDWIVNNPDINMVLGSSRPLTSRDERERDYPASDERCFPAWHNFDSDMPMLRPLRNRDALSNGYTDELYEFAPRPSCNRTHPECGSKYLFCHMPKNSDAQCMAKVRPGGKCSGFEGTSICYVGECVRGTCRKDISLEKVHKRVDAFWIM
ncbi:hypothetical protein KIN20_022690 [Parelaphostrongylus tenuis]|uniref:Uncharacterized protein n=1 Tax=Parelaphostrongylus tenuis TaxID=148309 RepID=A0AAD5N891_PARTN|nr:hypothetical protein KIN20_022690 [Parelaphostrongylus tenuis]